MELIFIPAGPFSRGLPDTLGDSSEHPLSVVQVDSFWIGRTEVANGWYKVFCDSTSTLYPPDPGFPGFANYFEDFPDWPVLSVSWYNAASFCNWLSTREGIEPAYDEDWVLHPETGGYHLPNETQWEKAARGTGDARLYPWGDVPPDLQIRSCNIEGFLEGTPAYPFTAPVNAMPWGASPFGVLNCAGNVWEWCDDWFDGHAYTDAESVDVRDSVRRDAKALRGGSWADDAWRVRVTNRGLAAPGDRYRTVGFRVARTELVPPAGGRPGDARP